MAFSETWLTSRDDLTPFEISGYSIVTALRNYSCGGGVSLYINQNCKIRALKIGLTLLRGSPILFT